MDDADRAQQRQEQELEAAIAAARGVPSWHSDPVVVCVECGADIEPVRQDLGFNTCAECADWLERRRCISGVGR